MSETSRHPKPSTLRAARRAAIVALALILSVVALAAQDSWGLGPYKLLVERSSSPLRVTMRGARGLGSPSFVGSVGGIAFEAVATPSPSVRGKDLRLSYDKSQRDGNRLAILIGNSVYRLTLPDWMLVPLSKYAESPYTACVSLFGERASNSAYDIVYHPAFQDTLMGLRLLQADILLMDVGAFWDLPRFNGKVVLGLGESMPHGSGWRSAARELQSVFRNEKFQSWVLTDYRVPVTFSVTKGAFTITGEPYYYFWKASPQRNDREPKIIEVKSLTEGMKAKRSALIRLNPAVYGVVITAMRFAALFKYVKRTKPANWTAFQKQMQGALVRPTVKTPTTWRQPAKRGR